MKGKIITGSIVIVFFLVAISFVNATPAYIEESVVKNFEVKENAASVDVIKIRVAILVEDKAFEDQDYGVTKCFVKILGYYSWQVGDTTYSFIPEYFPIKKLLRGELTVKNYDVLIYAPNTADEPFFIRGFPRLPRNIIWRRQITNYIKDGGGYFGTCGGAVIAGGMINKPDTFLERHSKRGYLDISGVNFELEGTIPLVTQIAGRGPESVDAGAYLFFSCWGGVTPHSGVSGACLDCPVLKDNPIFDDYVEHSRRIRWIGSPGFLVPENPDREISVLVRFPAEEISDNESTQIHYWEYIGGIRGLIKGQLFGEGEVIWCENNGRLMRAFLFSKDWKRTDKIVKTDVANKAFITSEIYPNENKARIVRSSGHPEFSVWWGGYIEEREDNNENCIYDGLYYWRDRTPSNETPQDEKTYNYWINRRCVAWASKKVPDNDLPPIYGPSQVSDIYPYAQTSEFTIYGNSETDDGFTTLDLYFRYSEDNTSWSDWILYSTDYDYSDGWSWEFIAPYGSGYYQFYSIRNVEHVGHSEIEKAPPGSDAIVHVEE